MKENIHMRDLDLKQRGQLQTCLATGDVPVFPSCARSFLKLMVPDENDVYLNFRLSRAPFLR